MQPASRVDEQGRRAPHPIVASHLHVLNVKGDRLHKRRQTTGLRRRPDLNSTDDDVLQQHRSQDESIHRVANATVMAEARSRRFAYAYVVGGVDPENPAYRNYLYDILVSTYLQRQGGSVADVLVLVQMTFASKYNSLPFEDLRWLRYFGIQVHYIPKARDESFYRIMLDKFRVLQFTQYERVIYMDGDVLALHSLDYLYHASTAGVLKRNVVLQGGMEPAQGGLFMLAPQAGDWERLLAAIHAKEERGRELPYPHFDARIGWGQAIESPDYYTLDTSYKEERRNDWNFHGAFTDQGLLYYWTKYVKKEVSFILRRTISHWGPALSSNITCPVVLEATTDLESLQVFVNVSRRTCWTSYTRHKRCIEPHSSFVHFTGKTKPWLKGPPKNLGAVPVNTWPQHVWFSTLQVINEKLQMGLNFTSWHNRHRPLLGLYPMHKDVINSTYYADSVLSAHP